MPLSLNANWPTLGTAQKASGLYHVNVSQAFNQPWMEDFAFQMLAQESRRGYNSNWLTFLTGMFYKYVVNRMDAASGQNGCEYYACLRGVYPYTGNVADPVNLMSNWITILSNTYTTDPGVMNQNGAPVPYASTCPATSMYSENPVGPAPWVASSLGQFALNSAIYGDMIGLAHCSTIVTEIVARMTTGNGGVCLGNMTQYPEFTYGSWV